MESCNRRASASAADPDSGSPTMTGGLAASTSIWSLMWLRGLNDVRQSGHEGREIWFKQLQGQRKLSSKRLSEREMTTYSRQKTCPHSMQQGTLRSLPNGSRQTSQTEPGPILSMEQWRDSGGESNRRGTLGPKRGAVGRRTEDIYTKTNRLHVPSFC